MSLSDLAALGSFVSGLAVAATLIFLLLQMRQTNQNQRSSMQLGRAMRHNELILKMSEPEIARIAGKASTCDELGETETRVFFAFVFADFQNWEDTFIQHRSGLLGRQSLASDEARLRTMIGQPPYRAMWRIISIVFGDEFRTYIEGIMKEIAPYSPGSMSRQYKRALQEQLAQAKPDHHTAVDTAQALADH